MQSMPKLFTYKQEVHTNGYEVTWEKSETYELEPDENGNLKLCNSIQLIASIGNDTREYEPLIDEPALFRKFAKLIPAFAEDRIDAYDLNKAILDFACKYGLLDGSTTIGYPPIGRTFTSGVRSYCDSFREWTQAIIDMSRAVELLDGFLKTEPYQRMKSNEVTPLNNLLEEKLKDSFLATVYNPDKPESFRIQFKPKNLLGVMWLQVAQQFTGETVTGYCAICSEPIVYGKDANKKSRLTCSGACRQKNYRREKESKAAMKD